MSSDLHFIDVREFVSLNIRCIQICGYLLPFPRGSQTKKTLYRLYAVLFVGFAYLLCLISQIANMVMVLGDIERMTEASFLLLTNLVQALKMYCFMAHESKVLNLIESVNRSEFQPIGDYQCVILQNDIRMSKLITKVFYFLCSATCLLWGIFPFLDRSSDGRVRLPLSGWYPFNTDESPIFEVVYFYQIFSTWVNGMGNISMDTFLSGLIMIVSSQLSLLNDNFENLKNEPSLVQHIVHYKQIIQFSKQVTSIFTSCLSGQFLISVIILCMTMFQMSLVDVFSLQFLSMTIYQSCIVLEIFLWCYFGNDLILKSEKLTQSAFSCKWVEASPTLKKNLIFFMIRSQAPLELYAGGYFSLSLNTFVAIVKSSWSYFAVLNRVHSS